VSRITNEQREAIVRRAIAERDAILDGRDPEAVAESCARAAYETANPNGKRWSYLDPGEWERWRAVANAVQRAATSSARGTSEFGKRSTSAATASGHELPNDTAVTAASLSVANGGDARVASAGRPSGVPACAPTEPKGGE
jgi:hypothetical protein